MPSNLDEITQNVRNTYGYNPSNYPTGSQSAADLAANPPRNGSSGPGFNFGGFFGPDPGGAFLGSQGLPSPSNGFGLFPKNKTAAGQFVGNFDPIGGFLLDSLFGGGNKRPPTPFYGTPFKEPGTPTYDPQSGFFQGLNTPEGVVDVTPYRKSRVERQSEASARALINTLPASLQAINAQILPNEISQLMASLITSPAYAGLQRDIFRQNSLSNAMTDKDILLGPGADVVQIANQLQRGIDPEYYRTRENTSNSINEQLGRGLSASERTEVERNLGRGAQARGDFGLQSNLGTVANAMNYGNLANQRQSDAIMRAIQFLASGARSGPDVLQQAIKSPSQISGAYANAREQSGQQPFQAGASNMNQLLSLIPQLQQVDASRPKNIDRVFAGINAFGNLAEGLGKALI